MHRPPLVQHGAVSGIDHFVRPDRLSQIVLGAETHRFLGRVNRRVPGDHDHFALGPFFLDQLENHHAVHFRHALIKQDNIKGMLFHHLQRISAVPYRCNAAVLSRQGPDLTTPNDLFVVYNQNRGFLNHFDHLKIFVLAIS